MKDDHNGRQPLWKTASMEDKLNGRQPQWKTTSMDKKCQWKKTLRKMTLACLVSQFCTELGPAQPELVFI